MYKALVKILVIGAYNSGKTTFVRTISETGNEFYSITRPDSHRQLGVDSGLIRLDDQTAILFIAHPSAMIFDEEWIRYLLHPPEHTGVVMLIDMSRPETFDGVEWLLRGIRAAERPYVIGLNRSDRRMWDIWHAALRIDDSEIMLLCDVRDRGQIARLLVSLMGQMPQDEVINRLMARLQRDVPPDLPRGAPPMRRRG